jgi:hypothetical protein
VIRVTLAKKWCDALRADGSLSVDWLATLAQPVERRASGLGEMWSIEASPAMWDELLAWGHAHRSVAIGASKQAENRAVIAGRIVDKVEKSLDQMSRHPGYRGLAIRSYSAIVLPAYRMVPPEPTEQVEGAVIVSAGKRAKARWWPTPRMAVLGAEPDAEGMEAGWLVPEQRLVRSSNVTRWVFDIHHPSYYSEVSTPTKEASA